MTADAKAIPRSPPIAQAISPPFILPSPRRLHSCPRLRVGNSLQAISTPKSRMGKSTIAVPLTYQPMIGGIPKVLCNQGITSTNVNHSNNENAPNTSADDKIPIGRGVASLTVAIVIFYCISMLSSQVSSRLALLLIGRQTGSNSATCRLPVIQATSPALSLATRAFIRISASTKQCAPTSARWSRRI